MSGRLIITTKKTYCPWNPANIERVLRDERLERERLERQQQNEEDESKRRRRRRNNQKDTNDDEPPQQGHINLFPEAREAEIRLAHGSSSSNCGGDAEKQSSGISPVPLGENESTNRKLGNVPFYMQTQSSSRQEDDKYVNSSHLGIRRNRMGVTTSSDEITNSIMRDQFASREEYRKQKNDPMSRFYIDSSDAAAAAGNIYANRESSSRAEHYAFHESNGEATSREGINNSPHHEHGQSQSRKRKKPNKSGEEEDRSKDSSSSSSSSLSSSTVSRDRRRRNKSRRKHDSKQSKRSKHRHRSDYSPLHSKKKRHKDKKSKRKHHSKELDDGDRRSKQRNNSSSSQSNMDLMESKKSDNQQLLDDMRRRRHDREARDMERQRQLMR